MTKRKKRKSSQPAQSSPKASEQVEEKLVEQTAAPVPEEERTEEAAPQVKEPEEGAPQLAEEKPEESAPQPEEEQNGENTSPLEGPALEESAPTGDRPEEESPVEPEEEKTEVSQKKGKGKKKASSATEEKLEESVPQPQEEQNGEAASETAEEESGEGGPRSVEEEQVRRRRRGSRLAAYAPHVTCQDSTRTMMLDVIIALMPALLFSGFYFFGYRSFLVTAVSIGSCVGFEALYRLLLRQRQTIGDLSAAVTGMLLAMTLPVTVPYWVVVIGSFFAIVVVKLLYGGLGKNFMNPALAGRVFLFSFPALINIWAKIRTSPGLVSALDAVTAATPMAALHRGELPSATLLEMLTGIRGGTIGEVSAALVLCGGLYLLARRVIRIRVPLCYVGTVALLTCLFPLGGNGPMEWMLYQLMSGGLLLGAFFMASDPITSPVTAWGQVFYGVGCGLLTVLLRYFGAYPEGVAFAILLMNSASWLLDRLGRTTKRRGRSRRVGSERANRKEEAQ